MSKALTVKSVEAVKPTASRQEIPDGGLQGLYLIVQPKKERDGKELAPVLSWAVRYRYGGKPKKFTIGPYPAYGLADARKAAGAALRAVAEGRDPAQEKKATKRSQTEDLFENVIDDFVSRHAEANNRASSVRETKRIIEADLKPRWKGRQIKSITRREIIALLDDITDRGAPILANRVLALLRKFFNWAIERDIVQASPAAGVKPQSQEASRDRVLSNDEIRLFWKGCDKIGWPFGPVFKLLLITSQRKEEVASATRPELDLTSVEPLWTIPKERAKNGNEHYVPLSPTAVGIFESLPVIKSKENFLFTTTGETTISGFSRAKDKLDAEMLKIAREEAEARGDDPNKVSLPLWRLHDLRRTAASGMASLSIPVHVVEAVLNHKSGSIKGVAAVYNRYSYADEKRRALNAWASVISTIVEPATSAKVIPIRNARS